MVPFAEAVKQALPEAVVITVGLIYEAPQAEAILAGKRGRIWWPLAAGCLTIQTGRFTRRLRWVKLLRGRNRMTALGRSAGRRTVRRR
ncbi:Uncharacterised protein [Kluyvera cryocrescens]|uniref:Uncharacterized protein n=1 Tax=Kluyvera cryocrescens TaxID=580 RepID=A0A485CFH1_KLUCR|nr:Uncharacterised protein [Kluyvera cryocrescens]